MDHQHKDPELWNMLLQGLVSDSRINNEGMRFGQLLYNAIVSYDAAKGRETGLEYDDDFHTRLFYIEDDKLLEALKDWVEWCDEQRRKETT